MNPAQFLATKKALLDAARRVRRKNGKSIRAQLREIRRLRAGPGTLRASDYYAFQLYDDAMYTPAQKGEFVNWHKKKLFDELNDPHWRGITQDKLVTYAMLRGLGLPFPEVYAVYHSGGRPFGCTPTLTSAAELADFLRRAMRYPFFAKPVGGSRGQGVSAVEHFDPLSDRLHLADGELLRVEEYVESRVSPERYGYLFQETVRQHQALQRVVGHSVATLRMIVLLGDDGPRLFRAAWRIPVGGSITDSFLEGKSGNLVAFVGVESGVVEHVVQGCGPAASRRPTQPACFVVDAHPDTGERLLGFTLPHWKETVRVTLEASASLVGLRFQALDVAILADGPSILEINSSGTYFQAVGGRGFNDDQFRAFHAKYAKRSAG